MPLSKEERQRIGKARGSAAGGDAGAGDGPAPSFATTAQSDLAVLEEEIGRLEVAGLLDHMSAAMYRLNVHQLRDPNCKPAERTKSIEVLARLRGMFAVKAPTVDRTPRDKTLVELLDELQQKMGLAQFRKARFEDLPREPRSKEKPRATVDMPAALDTGGIS